MEIGGVIAIIGALIFFGIVVALQGDGAIKGVGSTIEELPRQAELSGSALWQITILRKSGYIHDVREVLGNANDAIAKAISSCRRSGIYSLIITHNDPAKLEFYSSNQDGRGKAIGGFRIIALSDIVRPLEIVDEPREEVAHAQPESGEISVPQSKPDSKNSGLDAFGFPEQDAWEGSVYELGGRPFRCDLKLGFQYTDSNGAVTDRQIRTKAFVNWLDDDHLVLGFCNHRKANRSFATSRMQDVVDLDTGECIDDIDGYLTDAYAASDYKKVDNFIDNKMSVVECLLYLARLDGNLTKNQKTIINEYVAASCGAKFVTGSVASNLIKDFADDLTPQQFRKLLAQMQKEQPENLADLRDLGVRVVGARRGESAGGQAALAGILGVKG